MDVKPKTTAARESALILVPPPGPVPQARVQSKKLGVAGSHFLTTYNNPGGLLLLRPFAMGQTVQVERGGRTEWVAVGEREMLLIPPGVELSLRLPARTEWQVVAIPQRILMEVMPDGDWRWPAREGKSTRVLNACGARLLLDAMLEEGAPGKFAAGYAAESLTRLLLVEILRQLEPSKPRQTWVSIPPRQLRIILGHIEENLNRDLRLAELAAIHGWSPFYFCRIFKRATGYSPHQYVLRLRIDRAKTMLGDRSMELADIALELGFGSQSHFGVMFRRIAGCTPRQFRKLVA